MRCYLSAQSAAWPVTHAVPSHFEFISFSLSSCFLIYMKVTVECCSGLNSGP